MRVAPTEVTLKKRMRKRGHPSKMVGFRCPEELLVVANAEGEDQTDGLVILLDRGTDVRVEIGEELWREVGVLAHRQGITEGQAVGRLAREALERELKKSRR